MLNTKDLEKKGHEELSQLQSDLAQEIFQLKNEFSVTRKVEKPHLVRDKKRDRARVLTILNQKLKAS